VHTYNMQRTVTRGGCRVWKGGCILLKSLKTKIKKRRSRMSEGSSNITMKLKYIIIIPIYSFIDKLHCDCVTDCSIRVSRSFMTKDGGKGGARAPRASPGSTLESLDSIKIRFVSYGHTYLLSKVCEWETWIILTNISPNFTFSSWQLDFRHNQTNRCLHTDPQVLFINSTEFSGD